LSVILLSITRRSRKYSHAQTQEAPSPQGHPAVPVGPSDDGGPEPYRGTGGIPRTSPRMITRSWPISCKRLRRRARTASWVCRKLWRIVTTGCLDGRIGRGYRKEPEAWCLTCITTSCRTKRLSPYARLWLISTVKHPGGGCCAAADIVPQRRSEPA